MPLPPPRGPFAATLRVLAHPTTTWALLGWVGAAALAGLVTEPGLHPMNGLMMQAPMALLPFAVLARGLTGRDLRPPALWAVGLGLALAAGATGGQAGVAELGAQGPVTETYTVQLAGQSVEAHLEGQLTAQMQPGAVDLRLGLGDFERGAARVPLEGGAESALGPWAVSVLGLQPGDTPTWARLRATPRGEAAAEGVEMAVRQGSAAALPDGSQVAVLRLSPDFGGALGQAAQVQVTEGEAVRVDWVFAGSPDLDARVGQGKWAIELLSVESEPRLRLSVRRQGAPTLALLGWGLMVAGLGFGFARRAS